MNTTLHPLLHRYVVVFFDDILVYSRTMEEHMDHLSKVFQLLGNDQWHIKLSKRKFGQTTISYLGNVISQKGVVTDPTKIKGVATWPMPTTSSHCEVSWVSLVSTGTLSRNMQS